MQNREMSQGAIRKAVDMNQLSNNSSGSVFDLKLFDSLVNGVIVIDENLKMIYANPAIQQMCGLHSNRVGKKDLSAILSFEPDVLAAGTKGITDATPYREVIVKPKVGSAARVQVTIQALPGKIIAGQVLPSDSAEAQQWLIYIHDVTLEERLQKKYFEQLKEKEEFIRKLDRKLYETSLMFELAQGMNLFKELSDILNLILTKLEDAFAFSHSVIGSVDRETSFLQTAIIRENSVALNTSLRATKNEWVKNFYEKALAVGEPCYFEKGVNQEIDAFLSEVFHVDFSNYLFVPLTHKDEVGFLFLLDAKQAWMGNDDDLSLLFGIANQLLLAIDNNRLYEESMIDTLTGLYNLRYFQERLLLEFKRTKQTTKPLSVLMIDVDYFKKFNDNYGHAIGDVVLKQVAQTIHKTCRETDTAARYGGEEFVVILPETDSVAALIAAERIRTRIEAIPLKVGDASLKITASIGAACFPEYCKNMAEIVTCADSAMYVAKRGGRNNSKLYSPDKPKGPEAS